MHSHADEVMRLTQCVVAGASIGDGGETASGGAGGCKATPLAGPAFCAQVSSLSLKDGFDFSIHDSRGPINGYSARLVAEFCVRRGPIMVCTSASSSGVEVLTATTEQPYYLAQERWWFERPLGSALRTDTLTLIRAMGRRRRGGRRAVGSRRRQCWRCRCVGLPLPCMAARTD